MIVEKVVTVASQTLRSAAAPPKSWSEPAAPSFVATTATLPRRRPRCLEEKIMPTPAAASTRANGPASACSAEARAASALASSSPPARGRRRATCLCGKACEAPWPAERCSSSCIACSRPADCSATCRTNESVWLAERLWSSLRAESSDPSGLCASSAALRSQEGAPPTSACHGLEAPTAPTATSSGATRDAAPSPPTVCEVPSGSITAVSTSSSTDSPPRPP
mmetsp:Transcript_40459/g.108520  ORF Transcript_40459/g.108520 Transcript_40459/m.108520 type:complete len:223 (+) Transcript_40459:1273-1941(+)